LIDYVALFIEKQPKDSQEALYNRLLFYGQSDPQMNMKAVAGIEYAREPRMP
jgi:hypothetical protein